MAKCEGPERGSPLRVTLKFLSYKILALPLTPTLVQVDLEFRCSHLSVKWEPWQRPWHNSGPPLCLCGVYLKHIDFKLPRDLQQIRSPEVPSHFGQPGSDQTACASPGPLFFIAFSLHRTLNLSTAQKPEEGSPGHIIRYHPILQGIEGQYIFRIYYWKKNLRY